MIHSSHGGWKKAPLAFSPCFYLGLCAERPRVNPFDEFLEAAEDVRHHYRELSKTDFENITPDEREPHCHDGGFARAVSVKSLSSVLHLAAPSAQLLGFCLLSTLKIIVGLHE